MRSASSSAWCNTILSRQTPGAEIVSTLLLVTVAVSAPPVALGLHRRVAAFHLTRTRRTALRHSQRGALAASQLLVETSNQAKSTRINIVAKQPPSVAEQLRFMT